MNSKEEKDINKIEILNSGEKEFKNVANSKYFVDKQN